MIFWWRCLITWSLLIYFIMDIYVNLHVPPIIFGNPEMRTYKDLKRWSLKSILNTELTELPLLLGHVVVAVVRYLTKMLLNLPKSSSSGVNSSLVDSINGVGWLAISTTRFYLVCSTRKSEKVWRRSKRTSPPSFWAFSFPKPLAAIQA